MAAADPAGPRRRTALRNPRPPPRCRCRPRCPSRRPRTDRSPRPTRPTRRRHAAAAHRSRSRRG
ncbi:MAG: hypothetical protein FGM25_02090 [Mycobacterium sp.]|nr:hypothetical protein [Mycobacterium sp.]